MGRAEPQCIEGGPWVNIDFNAFDSAKEKHAVAIADDGRDGQVRYLGEIDNSPDAVRKLVSKLSRQHEHLHFRYEAGPDGGMGYDRSGPRLRCHSADDDSEALWRSGQDQAPGFGDFGQVTARCARSGCRIRARGVPDLTRAREVT
jgi:hypothetical protein